MGTKFYRLTAPAYVLGTYYAADRRTPMVIEFPDDMKPSQTWEEVEGPATAPRPLYLQNTYTGDHSPRPPQPEPVAAPSSVSDVATLAEAGGPKSARGHKGRGNDAEVI